MKKAFRELKAGEHFVLTGVRTENGFISLSDGSVHYGLDAKTLVEVTPTSTENVWHLEGETYSAEDSDLRASGFHHCANGGVSMFATPQGNLFGAELCAHIESEEVTHWTAEKFGFNFIIFND